MARGAPIALGAALIALLPAACTPTTPPGNDPTATSVPAPEPIPSFDADGPSVRECYPPRVRALGVPRQVPVPEAAVVQGPDTYAGGYAPDGGGAPRTIQGRAFAYEVGSPAALVAGFHEACLQPFGPAGWRRLRGQGEDVLFRIPRTTGPDAVVLVAAGPDGSLVVVFDEWTLSPGP